MTNTEKDVKWWSWASVWILFSAALLVMAALGWRHYYAKPVEVNGYTRIKVSAMTADGSSVKAVVELVSRPEDKAVLEAYQGNITVAVTGILSAQDRSALVDSDNRKQLKEMILERANRNLPPGKRVDRVLLTDFLVGGG